MYIQNNLLGINSLNNNKRNMKRLEKSINKLSSGHRINIAVDDAAGLAISEKMKGQIRGLKMGSRNALDAYSLMETRDGALDEIHHMMQRMRELTIQSLNDTLTDEDRGKLQEEFRALQIATSKFTEESQWNTKPIFEAHESSFYNFEGNQDFNGLVKIVEGFNNDLEIAVDGNITSIFLDEGYYTIGEIADIIDDQLIEQNPNLILNLTENNSISIQSENSSNIDYIKGGLSFLFYDYHIGTPPGMIIGVTEFKENGRLNIIPGHNDKLKFYVGTDKEYTINFSPKAGGYSIDELIDIINNQLKAQGEYDVEAIKYSDKHIALYSDKHVITGLSGNMIKIDDITSVLYDNAKYGRISEGQGYVSGRKNLNSGITITKGVNDTLKLKVNDDTEYKTIDLLDENEDSKHFTLDELVGRINAEAEDKNIGITAEGGGSVLRIKSNYYGDKSKIELDKDSNAYKDLFVEEYTNIIGPKVVDGAKTNATIMGRYVIGDSTKIKTGVNDTLEITVDENTQVIVLDGGNYSKEGLINEINSKLENSGLNANATLVEQSAIAISNEKVGGGSIEISQSTGGFKDLFCEQHFSVLENKDGKTEIIEEKEGIVGPIEIVETSAVLVGSVDLSQRTTIDATNDKLNFNMSGEDIEITLDHGSFKAEELVSMINDKLSGKDIEVSLKNNPGYGTNLVFTTKNKGEGQYFRNIGGTAYSTILARTIYSVPKTSDTGITSNYSITGRLNIGDSFTIDETNNKFEFTYVENGTEYKIDLNLEERTYTKEELVNELNTKIEKALKSYNQEDNEKLIGDEISAIIENSRIVLSTKNSGSDYKLKDFEGNFYDVVFKEEIAREFHPYSYSGYSNSENDQLTYIVGREDLYNKEIIIHPHINDVLIFDFYHNSKKETFEIRLDPGIQNKISEELVKKGYESDMLKVQIGGVESGTAIDDENKLVIKYAPKDDGKNNNGSYIIDGVRGSAAYTVFYKAEGDPSPTHTVGAVDLSNGAKIKTGINDTFTMNINEDPKTIVLDEGEYTSEELLLTINEKLKEQSTNIIASYYEGRLKLSFNEVGYNTIDGISGNAKGTLFFNTDSREYDKPEYFQIGANSGDTLIFDRPRISTELTITIHKSNHANKALGRLDNAINYLSSERGRIGAAQNRLESIIRNNENYEENLTAANSRIEDLDMAKETLEFTKQQILQQATQMMIANARHQPEMVLKLLYP